MTLCSHHKLAPPALSMIIFFSGALPRPCKRVLALTAASLACHRALCAKTFEFHYGLGRHRGLPVGLHPRPCSLFNCVHFDASSSDARVVCGVRCRVLVLATLRVPFLGCFLELEAHRWRFVNLSVVRQRMVTVSNSLVSLLKPPLHPLYQNSIAYYPLTWASDTASSAQGKPTSLPPLANRTYGPLK